MSNSVLIICGGIYCLIFTLFHLTFWKLFNWKQDLLSLSFINRCVMQILNLCLSFIFAGAAYLSLVHGEDLLATDLGHTLLKLIAIFCFFRAWLQVYFFGVRNIISAAFFIVFVAGGFLYLIPASSNGFK